MAKWENTAFDEIYQKYAKLVYGYTLHLCRDPVTAEDIVQTTFLKAIEHADSFKGTCSVGTWLCQIAKNTWLDLCRRAERKNMSVEQMMERQGEGSLQKETAQEADLLHGMVKNEERIGLYQQIHMLPETYKEVFLLRVTGCLSFREIGEVFGKSETWGRVTFYRAKEKLRNQIGDDTYEM